MAKTVEEIEKALTQMPADQLRKFRAWQVYWIRWQEKRWLIIKKEK